MFFKNKVHVSGTRAFKRDVSFYWGEKIWLFIDYLQVYGALWNMGQSWGWPFIWIDWTKWTVWANFDYFSTTPNGATGGSSNSVIHKFGEMNNYIEYAFLFMIIPVVILVCVAISRRITRQYGKRYDVYEAGINYWALFFMQILYMPVCLAVSRLYYCENGVLSVDPTNACMEGQHLIMSVLGLVCTLPLFIGLPIYVYKCIHDVIIFEMSTDHEKRLQAWELEAIFGLDTFWDRSQLWLTSSFNRQGAFFRFNILVFKSYTLFVFLLFRFSMILQAIMFWIGTVYVFYLTLKLLPFRVKSSNLIACVLVGLLLINTTFALCNAFGVENSVMVASVESIWLLSFNSAGLFLILIVLALSLTGQFDRWPTSMTLKRISRSAKWPTMVKWLDTIEESNAVNLDVCLCPPETADIMALEESIRQLRKCWMDASSIGSVFTVILSDNLNKLMITHSVVSPNALRSKKYWDKEYLKSGREMFDSRHKKYNLWNEKKRKMQLKLFAVSALLGGKIVKKVHNYDRHLEGMPENIRRRLGEMMGQTTDNQTLEVREQWNSDEEYTALMNKITLLTARTEAALRDKEEVAEYARVLQSDEEKRKEQIDFLKQIDELTEIYEEWDMTICQFENKELPGGGGVQNEITEDWYTYRHVTANTLGTIRGKIIERVSGDSDDDSEDDADFNVTNNVSESQPLLDEAGDILNKSNDEDDGDMV